MHVSPRQVGEKSRFIFENGGSRDRSPGIVLPDSYFNPQNAPEYDYFVVIHIFADGRTPPPALSHDQRIPGSPPFSGNLLQVPMRGNKLI